MYREPGECGKYGISENGGEGQDLGWTLLSLNYADFFIVNPALWENTSGIDSLDHLLRP